MNGAVRGDSAGEWIIVQPVDEHDSEMLPEEEAEIKRLCPGRSFSLIPVRVDWFQELTPWKAKGVFKGQPDFGDGAEALLKRILDEMVLPAQGRRFLLGGYSLAGLFALWAGTRTDAFSGIAAASPSVWYPEWMAYAERNECRAPAVYLSLGDAEERTRNPVMRTVGESIRRQYDVLRNQGIAAVLEWNRGNHFTDADKRTAAGFAWIMNRETGRRTGAGKEKRP